MASMSVSEDNLSCHECCEVIVDDNDPVFSRNGCMRSYWETKGGSRGRSPTKLEPPFNLNLKSLLESFVKEGSSQTGVLPCPLHHATLKFYCESDKQLMCVMCRDSKLHKYHSFSHIEDAAKGRKETLKKASLRPLKDKLKRFNDMRLTCDKAAQHLKVQAQQTEKQIKQNFEKLHQFLRDEEAARIAALMEEEEKKSQIIKEKIEEMSRDISSLSNTIRALEEEMKADDVTFLQNYNATVERAQCTLPAPERLPQGALINVAKHLGNLKFRVWEKMKALIHYTPVILDPNTAHSQLVLSKDMAGLTYNSQRQQVPDNPERLDRWCVLGAEGFDSGRHWWDVEIYDSGKGSWYLGLLTESSMRDARGSPWSGFWCLFKHHGKYSARCPGSSDILIAMEEKPQKPRVQMDWVKGKFWSLWSGYCGQVNYYVKYDAHSPAVSPLLIKLKQKPQKIRVQLDWDRGQLTFSNPDNNRHLHTFPYPFTERMFPCFYAYNCSLRVVPVRPAVILKQLC